MTVDASRHGAPVNVEARALVVDAQRVLYQLVVRRFVRLSHQKMRLGVRIDGRCHCIHHLLQRTGAQESGQPHARRPPTLRDQQVEVPSDTYADGPNGRPAGRHPAGFRRVQFDIPTPLHA